jgi:predicted metal-dependent HD superfamily phosphohydrolase
VRTNPFESVSKDLHRQWLELLQPFAVPQSSAERTFDCLLNAYLEPGRFYHNLSHIEAMLATVGRLTADGLQYPALQLAVWFHDAVYDTHAKDNEEQSAMLAGNILKEMNIPAPIMAATQHLILLTKNHVVDENDEGKILLDADLAILGETSERYEAYARAIRQEYAWVPEADYRAGRSKILADFLKRPRIYHTGAMFAECEQTARKNLAAEIERLTSS